MYIAFGTQIFIYYVAAAMTLATTVFFLIRGKKSALLYSFIVLQVAILAWILRIILVKVLVNGSITPTRFEVITYDYYEWIHYKLRYLINTLAGLCWLVFCLLYTNENKKNLKKWLYLSAGCFPPAYFLSILATETLSKNHPEISFWIQAAAQYAYYLAGIALLLRSCRNQTGAARKQSILLFVSMLLPAVLTFVQDYKRMVLHTGGFATNFDITPLGFIAAILIIALATYRYRFLNIIPMALQKLVADMNQAIAVLDSKNRIMDCNPAFRYAFMEGAPLKKNKPLKELLQILKERNQADFDESQMIGAVDSIEVSNAVFEISCSVPQPRFFSVEIQPITSKDRTVLGKVASFQDITEYKSLLREIRQQYEELQAANAKLKEYAEVSRELAVANERNKLSREVHDTLGHTLTMLVAMLEVSSIACVRDPEMARDKVREAASIAREGLRGIQNFIAGIAPKGLEPESLGKSLENLTAGFKSANVGVELIMDDMARSMGSPVSEALYRVCQEALTNALRHGRATQISIILKAVENRLKLYIIDNGCGCPEIHKGYGLTGMEQRIVALGGTLFVSSDGESGFHVYIEVPMQWAGQDFEGS